MQIHRWFGFAIPVLLCAASGVAAQTNAQPAPAVTMVLMTSDVQLAADGTNVQTTHVEMRAGNEAGAQILGQANIPFDITGQDVTVVEAHTLKSDGKSLPVDASAIYDQPLPGEAGQVTGLRAKLIIFPQLTAGDTAVYTIKTTTRTPNFKNQFFYTEFYPRTQAYNEVRETITAPKSLPLYVESHDVSAGKQDNGATVTYSWHYSAPTPIAKEPATLSPLDHVPRFFVSSFKDYAQMGQAYAALADPRKIVTPKIQALADSITSGVSDPKNRAQKLYEWVSGHIRYVGIELGTGSFTPHDVDAIVDNGYGDCKDHDVLLEALLKAKGIDAQSILLNGDSSYTLADVPTFTSLNHVITFVPQLNLYLDSSAGTVPFGVLPLQEYGKSIVVAASSGAGVGRMPLLQPGIAKVTIKTVATLDTSGELTGTNTTTASGPYAPVLRQIGLLIQAAGPAAATNMLTAMGYENPSGTFTQDSPSGFDPDYTISSTFKMSRWADNLSGKNSFYMPPGPRLIGQSGDNVMGSFDPDSLAPGEPTVCLSAEQSEDLSLTAPDGHRFEEIPSDTRVETPNLSFVAHWSLAGNTLTVHRDFTSKIDQPLCTGTVRAQTAAALKQIAASYNTSISFASAGADTDAAANAALGFYNNGVSYANAGEYEQAISEFTKAIVLKPDDFYPLANRSSAYLHLQQYSAAIDDLDQAVKLKPDDYGAYFNRGLARKALKQNDLAVADFSKAIALKPDDASSYKERAAIYIESKQLTPALADFDKVIALAPDSPDIYAAYLGRGLIESATQPKAAIDDFSHAIALQPGTIEFVYLRGFAYFRSGDYARAITDFDKVIAQRPDDANSLFYRGGAKDRLGQKKDGEKDIAAAVKLDPSLAK